MDTKDQESQREAATTTEGITLSQVPQKTRTHGNNGDRNPPIALDRRDTNGKAWAFGPITR